MAFRHLLVPVDFTDASERALDYAVALAGKLGAQVTVIHAYQVPSYTFPEGAFLPTADLAARLAEAAQRHLDEVVGSRSAKGARITKHLRNGDAAEETLAAASELGADAIVMGTHGSGALQRALLGSVAAKVIRASPLPVITVRGSRDVASSVH